MDLELTRLQKLEQLKKLGINPYPVSTGRNTTCKEAKDDFDKLSAQKKEVVLAGRLVLLRLHGGAAFAHLEDGTEKIQILFRRNVVGEENYKIMKDLIDLGDFLEVTGSLFLTKTNEKTLEVKKFRILTKSILPLPEKWHGLEDVEIRFRQRYLDLIANPEVKKIFLTRSLLVTSIRDFFNGRGYLEVDTPILQQIYGGANAAPFITHHNALDMDLYLRIAPELYLKRLIVGGYERVYEIARCFRNEGIDREHNPEFTQIEFYQAYANYRDLMVLTEDLMKFLSEKVCGKLKIDYQGREIDFTPPYPRITYREAIKKYAGLDIDELGDNKGLTEQAQKAGLPVESNWGRGKLLDELFKKFARPRMINPVFLIDHPVELSPLAKRKEDNHDYVERFQLLVAGMEICNAFSELNDPLDQEARFKEQQAMAEAGDQEAQQYDADFIEALKHGMPTTAGEGIGIDRLAILFNNVHNIREVILFPTMRPKEDGK
ncbi:MAG: lysine--tRNA ligase [Candidatus Parcubacteria bacterium]|nr:lysine--tRNA ligase [Candidatus Parcubacteria bacterium]